jgi:N-acetylglutamate synthase-like GNAT family acetyltransferase
MTSDAIALIAFSPDHLQGAVQLSQQAGWPHRPEDWHMALAMSKGCVAVARQDNRVIGTALMTPYGSEAAAINMVIVDAAVRAHGTGRKLMEGVLSLAGDRSLQLVATESGLSLYEKLGFRSGGVVVQHQGQVVKSVTAPSGVRAARPDDLAAITELDRAAYGAERRRLIALLADAGSFAVLERMDHLVGFAVLRPFGRGEVIGPVVAANLDDARLLVSHFLAARAGAFLRIDTDVTTGLGPWLAGIGLADVGGGIAMRRPIVAAAAKRPFFTFALANQAFG